MIDIESQECEVLDVVSGLAIEVGPLFGLPNLEVIDVTSQAIDAWMARANERLAIKAARDVALGHGAAQLLKCSIEYYMAIKGFEVSVNSAAASMRARTDDFNARAQFAGPILKRLEKRVEATLDRIDAIDPSTCSQEALRQRGRLIEISSNMSDALHSAVLGLLLT